MLQEQNISQDGTEEPWRFHHHGSSAGQSVSPVARLVVWSLALLDALLLLAAVVIGIFCAKTTDHQVPDSAATPFIIELSYLTTNHSDMIRDRLQIQADMLQARSKHMQLVLQLKQEKMVTDVLQRQMETLHTEKSYLDQNVTTLGESCGRCLNGWTLFKSSCYYFSNGGHYDQKTWSDSRADCKSRGADLVVIDNMEEQVYVNNKVPRPTNLGSWRKGSWMGLTHGAGRPGVWMWVNNVTETETQYWTSGQPNYQGPEGGNCSAFNPHTGNPRRTWYSLDCHNTLDRVCETGPVS